MRSPFNRLPIHGPGLEFPVDDSPLDLAPRRVIAPRRMMAPRRRLREFPTDHVMYRNSGIVDELTEDSINRMMTGINAITPDVEQLESPTVIFFFY